MNAIHLLLAVPLLLMGCKKDAPDNTNQTAGMIRGKVLTADGRPVAGAKIVVSSVIWYNENTVTSTLENGTYSRKLAGLGSDAFTLTPLFKRIITANATRWTCTRSRPTTFSRKMARYGILPGS
ncbi:carboxypeptidase-like regulatory domain-containing protein [Chitinophaga sedimenti]|uniref:carboxypeptidase-like regulatory domain-containing protein n=1 Tax=Chitinophaga sedimenti TaxID=2033606 RepID=UPI0020064EEC|nr:carboxypeptidase-like regulatory domain-containing protein [Chitinophaga sedimenti]MCK7554066.1 carboxypeptidase-like regulatory domain-containing protein [Chitinophaga sedimenti]